MRENHTVDRHGIETTGMGYVRGLSCPFGHAGNTAYTLAHGEYYACQGCGTFEHLSTIRRRQRDAIAVSGECA